MDANSVPLWIAYKFTSDVLDRGISETMCICVYIYIYIGERGSLVVKVLGYKP
jgi:hypothetical protein